MGKGYRSRKFEQSTLSREHLGHMWPYAVIILAWILGKDSSLGPPILVPATPETFTLDAYLGLWYQIADIPQWYEKDCNLCTQATYSLPPEGSTATAPPGTVMALTNRAFNPQNAQWCVIEGFASMPDPSIPTHLEVTFSGLNFPGAPYWIEKLGPIVNGSYSLAVVSGPFRKTLYVLARKQTLPSWIYNQVIGELHEEGYPTDALVVTRQICT